MKNFSSLFALIFVFCFYSANAQCDDPDFEIKGIEFTCSKLTITIKSQCPDGVWSFASVGSVTAPIGYSSTPGQAVQIFQVSNLNAASNPELTVIHSLFSGNTKSVTINLQTLGIQGILIGLENNIPNFLGQYNILPGASHTSTKVYCSGTMVVNKSFEFNNVEVQNHPCAEWVIGAEVGNMRILTIRGNSNWHGCTELWKGLRIKGGNRLNIYATGTNVPIIQDAMRAVRLDPNNPILDVSGGKFYRNAIGVIADFNGAPSSINIVRFRNATIDGDGETGTSLLTMPACMKAEWQSILFGESFQTNKGLCGIHLREINHDVKWLNSTDFSMEIQDVSIGLSLWNTSFAVNNAALNVCKFNRITEGLYVNLAGTCIQFWDDSKRGSQQFTFSAPAFASSASVPNFQNSTIGIYLYSTQPRTRFGIRNCEMKNMQQGVFAISNLGTYYGTQSQATSGTSIGFWLGGIQQNRILVNTLHNAASSNKAGVYYTEWSPLVTPSQIQISGNRIVAELPNSRCIQIDGNAPNGGQTPTNTGLIRIHRNSILGSGGDVGIYITSRERVGIYSNQPSANSNVASTGLPSQITFNSFSGGDGISIYGGGDNYVSCNKITRNIPGFPGGAIGLSVSLTQYTNIRNNLFETQKMDYGMYAYNGVQSQDIRCNTFDGGSTGKNGLYVYKDVGPQYDEIDAANWRTKGNIWTGAFIGKSAELNGLPGNNNYFGVISLPQNVVPAINWFYLQHPVSGNSVQGPADCKSTCPLPSDFFEDAEETVFDKSVALNQFSPAFPSTAFISTAIWNAKRGLMRKLARYPNLLASSTQSSFLTNESSTTVHKYFEVEKAVAGIYQLTSNEQASLDQLEQTIAYSNDQIAIVDSVLLDSTLNNQQMLDLLVLRANYLQPLNSALLSAQQISDNLSARRFAKTDSLLIVVNNLAASDLHAVNEKTFWRILLQTNMKHIMPNETQLSELETIASQCPLDGGQAVVWAQAMHYQITGRVWPIPTCLHSNYSGEEVQDRSKPELAVQSRFIQFSPNPSEGMFNLTLRAEDVEEPFEVTIFDSFGRIINSNLVVSGNISTLNLSEETNGVYTAIVRQNKQIVQVERLMICK